MKRLWPWMTLVLLAVLSAVRNHATADTPAVPATQATFIHRDGVTAGGANTSSAAALPARSHLDSIVFSRIKGLPNYWRLGLDSDKVWWFISPEGNAEFLNTVTTVQPTEPARTPGDPHFVSLDWDGTPAGLPKWAAATWARVQAVGFKGIGAWSNPAFHQTDAPMTQDLNIWPCAGEWVRFYNPQWAVAADRAIGQIVQPLRENHSLVGYYLDNELDWGDGFAGPATYFDHLPAANPNRAQVMEVIRQTWPGVTEFNRDWNTTLKSLDEIDAWPSLPREPAATYARLSSVWLSHLATDYFRTTCALVRAHDPNHLILGIRYKGYAPREVVAASRDYIDAQSINYYVNDAQLDPELFRMIHDVSGEPIIISEYTFHSLDGASGDRDQIGFSAQVPDQLARAEGYALFTQRLARVPYIIGADWFQWTDEPPTGRADGEDVNFGVVDIHDRPYPMLADAVARTAPLLDPLHLNSDRDNQLGIWRDSFASKPIMHIPFLATAPPLNGSFDEWSGAALLPAIRRSQTVGLDRSLEPNPSLYLGWNRDGIYLGLQVFNDQIIAPADKGSWWTRDYAEFCISTRPVEPNQTSYNAYCHEFFFVPEPSESAGPARGVVGPWHRTGDALKDSLIPDPAIEDAVKILPDRYVLQMFIPAASLNGFDPDAQPAMAFNIHVRNFAKAQDYFWSAPPEVLSQQRPSTWGTIYLEPPPAPTVATGASEMDSPAADSLTGAMAQ